MTFQELAAEAAESIRNLNRTGAIDEVVAQMMALQTSGAIDQIIEQQERMTRIIEGMGWGGMAKSLLKPSAIDQIIEEHERVTRTIEETGLNAMARSALHLAEEERRRQEQIRQVAAILPWEISRLSRASHPRASRRQSAGDRPARTIVRPEVTRQIGF